MVIGHTLYGEGLKKVLIFHDWFCDHSSYLPCLPYLDTSLYTFCFIDLRGYGKSQETKGKLTLEEATADAVDLADHLGWEAFGVVGYSMTALVAQKMAALLKDRIRSLICVTPVPACGLPAPDDIRRFMTMAAEDNDDLARQIVHLMTGNRLSEAWVDFKVRRWRETSTPEARVAYMNMFVDSNIVEEVKGLPTPTCVLHTEFDNELHREKAMRETFGQWFSHLELALCTNAGHYPMQETPVYFATLIDHFLRKTL